MQITITEALAEVKTIGKRLANKRSFVETYIARQEIVHDPLTNQGGSQKAISEERQAMTDLEKRLVAIRVAINTVNATHPVTVNGETKTIAEWLTWRRDVVPTRTAFLKALQSRIAFVRKEAQAKGMAVVASTSAEPSEKNIIVNIDELQLSKDLEALETTLGTLDGLLSLANATTMITL